MAEVYRMKDHNGYTKELVITERKYNADAYNRESDSYGAYEDVIRIQDVTR